MKADDLLTIAYDGIAYLSPKEQKFIEQLRRMKKLTVSHAQYQYLQDCYDKAVAGKYGVEPLGPTKEFLRDKAIRKKREI